MRTLGPRSLAKPILEIGGQLGTSAWPLSTGQREEEAGSRIGGRRGESQQGVCGERMSNSTDTGLGLVVRS